MSTLIAKRYAKAFFDLAKDQDILKEAHDDFEKIRQALENSKEFGHLIESPIILKLKKQEILTSAFSSKIHKKTLNFLLFLVAKKRLNFLATIIDEFNNFYLQHQNIIKVVVTAREPLSEDLKKYFLTYLNRKFDKSVDPVWDIDPQLLGGFKIQAADHVEDYSLQNQLNQVEKALIYN